MALEKPLDALREADLQELITNGVSERRTIEYKQSLPGHADEDKKEFLADISSFANAAGGSVIYGMQATEGNPVALTGMQVANVDGEKLRLENMIRDSIAPRIIGVELGSIPVSTGGIALVVRIPRSLLSPHMITYRAYSKFFSRNSAGKYPLNVEELRTAFNFSAATRDRLRDFRAERISNIVAGSAPVSLPAGALVILHVVPLSALESVRRFNASELRSIYDPNLLQPIYSREGFSLRFNFDGLMAFDKRDPTSAWSYLQLFKNGSIETVSASFLQFGNEIASLDFEGWLLARTLPAYFVALKKLQIQPPLFLGLSLVGVRGYSMGLPPSMSFSQFRRGSPIDKDSLILPEVVAETFESKLDELMKPVFDSIWNASGQQESPYYQGSDWKVTK
jgi:hypothetical protein